MTRPVSLLFAIAACSSHGTPTHPEPGHDAGVALAEPNPSDPECDALFDHAITLQTSADTKLTDDDRAKLRTELRDRSLPRCRAMPRATYACALGAPTLDAFTSCDSAKP